MTVFTISVTPGRRCSAAHYSFDWKGVHVVVLMSVHEKDFWTARQNDAGGADAYGCGAGQRNPVALRGRDDERSGCPTNLAKVPHTTPIRSSRIRRSTILPQLEFWTDDCGAGAGDSETVQACDRDPWDTHQMLYNQIREYRFYGMLSTAWPWPYAPTGLPPLTVQMNAADPFDQLTARPRRMNVRADGLVDKIYSLWDRNPVTVKADYLVSHGKVARPPAPQFASY